MIDFPSLRGFFRKRRRAAAGAVLALFAAQAGQAQQYDCAGLQAKIADLDRAGDRPARGAGPSPSQLADLNRLISVARSLGCDRPEIAFSGGAGGRCPGLNAQIQRLQASVGRAQSQGGPSDRAAARVELIARFNTYCRNQPPRQRGFFEQLFGIPSAPETQPQPEFPAPTEEAHSSEEDGRPHGGSQALCVRTCDGGFFPLHVSARNADPGQLTSLCQALCPNATVQVFTRSPSRTIESAVSLEGELYSEMPNAGKFEKTFDPACTCKPPGKSWVEALAGADGAFSQPRKGDILVTPEKSVELSVPKSDPRGRVSNAPGANNAAPEAEMREIVGPDGVKRRVRLIGPPL